MKITLVFTLTAMAEIGGCYAAYGVLRMGRHPVWLLAAVLLLGLFAWLLTLYPVEGAGRVMRPTEGFKSFWMWLVKSWFRTDGT